MVWCDWVGGGEVLPMAPRSPPPATIAIFEGGWLPELPLWISRLLRRLEPMVDELLVPMLLFVFGLIEPRVVVRAYENWRPMRSSRSNL